MNTKYVFVTGGVASSLGKGIIAASLAKYEYKVCFRYGRRCFLPG